MFEAFPALGRQKSYARMMAHLLFGARADRETGRLLMPANLMAALADAERAAQCKTFNAGHFIQGFRRDVLPTFLVGEYIRPSWDHRGRCRQVIERGLPPWLAGALMDELTVPLSQLHDPVQFVSGRRYTEAGRRAERERGRGDHVAVDGEGTPFEPSARLLRYLAAVPSNAFTRTLRYIPDAYAEAEQIDDAGRREHALRVLRAIERDPRPRYQLSARGRTVRVVGAGESLLSVKRRVRRALTQDWVEFDLQSLHLAIVARDWDVDEAATLLISGESIWDSLLCHVGSLGMKLARERGEGYDAVKSTLKRALYAAVYGMSRRRLVRLGMDTHDVAGERVIEARLGMGVDEVGRRFLQHPVVKSLLRRRSERMRAVHQRGGAEDCFGRWLPCHDRRGAASILAQQAQATELRLLLPALDLTEQEAARSSAIGKAPDFRIVLWQHDGFSVSFSDRSKQARHAGRIQAVVDAECQRLGYPTKLVTG